ncbi:MAG: RNA polymerase factor sigma-54, partial [Zoogloeaceae bacterium]|nr:RNA polymerase factor sigma-54 [Zoogloeaceae bacterium]
MKPSLQLRISQQLALTPQLQQSIKLLQLSTLDMNQEIERYLLENPLLERVDEGEGASYAGNGNGEAAEFGGGERAHDQDSHREEEHAPTREESQELSGELSPADMAEDRWSQDSGSYGSPGRERGADDEAEAQDLQAAATSLRDHLNWQLGLTQFSDHDRALIRFLIEGLDDDGYLSSSLEDLLETIPPEYEVEQADLEIALRQLQSLDPTGIGARSPQECLTLQL